MEKDLNAFEEMEHNFENAKKQLISFYNTLTEEQKKMALCQTEDEELNERINSRH